MATWRAAVNESLSGPTKELTVTNHRHDPVGLRVLGNLLDSVAEEMGTALERSGVSPNIKERRDHSCAIFDANAELCKARNVTELFKVARNRQAKLPTSAFKRFACFPTG